MNYCKYLKKRKNKPFCKLLNKEIRFSLCRECDKKEYKAKNDIMISNSSQINKKPTFKVKSTLKSGKMKNKSNKLAKLERNRKSIFADDLEHCYLCGKPKVHLHELFFGRNRLISIKYNFVIPVCNACHTRCHFDTDIIYFYRKECQLYYEKNIGSRNEFLAIFRRNYLK